MAVVFFMTVPGLAVVLVLLEHDGAPPGFRIDLGEGRTVIARAASPAPADA